MLSLNLLPSSNVTFSKPNTKHTINASLLNPNPAKRTQNRAFRNPTTDFKPSLSISEIPKSRSGFGQKSDPFRLLSRLSATGESPQDPTPDPEPEIVQAPNPNKTFKLAVVFGLWYFQNIVFNIYNKKALNIFPYPWFLASFQLLCGSVWMLILWSLKLQPCPKIDKPFILALLGPALFHTIGHISACVSFSKVAVSFTHVIKSAEPVFSVIFSTFLGETYPLSVWLSIFPIVIGCSLAAVTEVSFNFGGLWGAMISNVGFVLRNIYSKKSLQSFKEVNGLNLYGVISIISLLYLFPVAVFVEGSQWVPGYHKAIAAIGKPSTFYLWVMVAGIFYHLYNQSSYEALDDISPLSFSVGNTMKRVVVIVATVLVFRNPVQPLNALGSAIAIFGTFLYSQATAKKPKKD
ncbi:xylulose 5-phosphate/phosphate translocator chloroplastic [Phtheirospermum japonicum]|uniref:Xylulose 5-phosphate/phosphate translocator chloroplastic n=1 Tax=Phtheirospermum japonicum TaxID=374723 RepID=A0A830CD10_9LAMI|nr:xylulose 5-phosphate/phosphate translocator chloroplastic [Phtheirospermum japonicum]